jgi:Concanavalin A-like lectin/glucanases superfamily
MSLSKLSSINRCTFSKSSKSAGSGLFNSNLLIWYNFDSTTELNSTTLFNYATNAYDSITLGGGSINTTTKKFGSGSLYSGGQGGANNAFITANNITPPIYNTGGGYTITFWMYLPQSPYGSFVSWGAGLPSNFYWAGGTNAQLIFGATGTGNNCTYTYGSLSLNTWYFIAAVVSYPSPTTSTITFYISTTSQPTASSFSQTVNYVPSSNSIPIQFSQLSNATYEYIDDFRYYNVPLSLSQIQTIYNGNSVYASSWLPTNVSGCQLWLDSTDSSTITATSGVVSSWNDKSGLANHFTGGNSPKTGTLTINNLNVMDLVTNSAAYFYSTSNFTLPTNYSIFFIGYTNIAQSSQAIMVRGKTDQRIAIQQYTTTMQFNVGAGSWTGSSSSIMYNTNVPYLIEMTVQGGTGNAIVNGYYNGKLISNNTAASHASIALVLSIGGMTTGTWSGGIGEVLIYNSVLSSSDRQSIENYLYAKWGINKYSNDCSSITGWTTGGTTAPTIATISSQTGIYAVSGGSNYAYINTGITSLKGKNISFNVYLTGGCPEIYFACNSSGAGQMFRFETRTGNVQGFASTTAWGTWNNPANSGLWTALNTWTSVMITISYAGVAKIYVNGTDLGFTYTIADNGGYIGIQADNGGGAIYINNIFI